eukprot:6208235-Pleurochrysis_carterae.AAC.2
MIVVGGGLNVCRFRQLCARKSQTTRGLKMCWKAAVFVWPQRHMDGAVPQSRNGLEMGRGAAAGGESIPSSALWSVCPMHCKL